MAGRDIWEVASESLRPKDKKKSPTKQFAPGFSRVPTPAEIGEGDPANPKESYGSIGDTYNATQAWLLERTARAIGQGMRLSPRPLPTSAAKRPKYKGDIYQGKRK